MIADINDLISEVRIKLREFTDIAVIGMSGGADSTLVALLCREALGADNVYAVHMPFGTQDFIGFNVQSVKIAEHLGFKSFMAPISTICTEVFNELEKSGLISSKKGGGNTKARIRMTTLYSITESLSELYPDKKVRVIGTDNYSENFLGYFTKYGDGGVDINPIEDLFKSEVYQLLDQFKSDGVILEEHINRTPSAGLWEGQTDEGELGFSYDEIEKSIIKILNGDSLTTTCDKFVKRMHENTEHKRQIPYAINLNRFTA